MKPRTKLQKEVLEMAKKLPPLTEVQKDYPYKKIFHKIGYYWKKGEVWCQCCGHVDEVLQPMLAVSLGVGSHICPGCGANLKLEHWSKGSRRHSNESCYYSIVQSFNGWIVVRTFDVHRNNSKGNATGHFISEVYQNWLREDGKEVIIGKKYTRNPFHFSWHYDSDMDVKYHNNTATGYYEMEDVFDVSGNYIYPRVSVIPVLKRNGWTNDLLKLKGVSVVSVMQQLLTNPIAETLVKTGQMSVFKYMMMKGNYTIPYQHSLNICNRNHYIIKDASLWFDYLDTLAFFNVDTHNAHYVCPPNLKEAHDLWMRRKRKAEAKRKLEEKRKEIEAADAEYKKIKGRFLDIHFSDGTIFVGVLQSVKEFFDEGELMHHCVFSNGYYKKKDSLILSARVGKKHVETIEINLKTLAVVQSRGACNQNTEYHERIIGLVKKNIGLIRQKIAS